MRFLRQPDSDVRLGDFLKTQLSDAALGWREFRAGIAFVKRAGVEHLAEELAAFGDRGGAMRISVGVDLRGSSREGLTLLHEVVSGHGGEVWIFHNAHPSRPTFHPKIYLFKKPDLALVVIGSGNLTNGGLFTNYEANFAIELEPEFEDEAKTLHEIEATLDAWVDPRANLARVLTLELLAELEARGVVVTEAGAAGDEVPEQERDEAPAHERERAPDLFGSVAVPRAPARARRAPARTARRAAGAAPAPIENRGFLMTLHPTDMGVGQTTRGTSRRSPEIFIPLAARDENPDFWGWPDEFEEDRRRAGKFDRMGVRVRIGGEIVPVNMMTWPDKHDFRMRSEAIRSAGRPGDILRMERAPERANFDYYVEIVPQGTTEHAHRLAQCVRAVRPPSRKRFGYY